MEKRLHLQRGRGLPCLPEKEIEGEARPPFVFQRQLPHSHRSQEVQRVGAQQEDLGLRRPEPRRAESVWSGEIGGVK